jgi:hypothetical protein
MELVNECSLYVVTTWSRCRIECHDDDVGTVCVSTHSPLGNGQLRTADNQHVDAFNAQEYLCGLEGGLERVVHDIDEVVQGPASVGDEEGHRSHE